MPNLMLFSGGDNQSRLMQFPDDFEEHEVYRYVTALISSLQEQEPECSWEDVEEKLEEKGFKSIEFVQGPTLLCKKQSS